MMARGGAQRQNRAGAAPVRCLHTFARSLQQLCMSTRCRMLQRAV